MVDDVLDLQLVLVVGVVLGQVPELLKHNTGHFSLGRYVQGVPYHWAHFVFVIFSGSRAHTEEHFIAHRIAHTILIPKLTLHVAP